MQIKPASLFFHLSYSSENVIVSQHLNQDFSIKVAQEPQTSRHKLTSPTVWYGEVCCSDADYSSMCQEEEDNKESVNCTSRYTTGTAHEEKTTNQTPDMFFLMMQQSDCAQVQSLTQQKLLLQE